MKSPATSLLPSTLPASWYTSDRIVDLAREHIFNKGWLFVTPVVTFAKGDQEVSQFDFIGNPFFVLNDIKDPYNCQEITAYYGVFAEVIADCKTPEEKLEKLATLKTVRSFTDPNGLFFICHDKTGTTSWSEFYGEELQNILKAHDFKKMKVRRRLVYDCSFNFITFIDGYQECLHCTYTHPGLKAILPLEAYKIENFQNFSRHHCYADNGVDDADGVFIYFFPNSALNFYKGGMSCLRVNPVDGNNSRMEFDYFFNGSDEEFEEYYKFARQVATEDQDLCEACQKNLRVGLYQNGILNPNKENGVIFYQGIIRNRIMSGVKEPAVKSA